MRSCGATHGRSITGKKARGGGNGDGVLNGAVKGAVKRAANGAVKRAVQGGVQGPVQGAGASTNGKAVVAVKRQVSERGGGDACKGKQGAVQGCSLKKEERNMSARARAAMKVLDVWSGVGSGCVGGSFVI